MRPGEVVVHVRNVPEFWTEQVVQLRVLVVRLHPGLCTRQGRVCGIPLGEQVVERLVILRVVSHASVEGVPCLVELCRS